jgi:hypothetical protein
MATFVTGYSLLKIKKNQQKSAGVDKKVVLKYLSKDEILQINFSLTKIIVTVKGLSIKIGAIVSATQDQMWAKTIRA